MATIYAHGKGCTCMDCTGIDPEGAITHDDLWLCEDCHLAASGADVTIIDQQQAKATEEGLARLSEDGHLVPDSNSETGDGCDVLMSARCSCCNVLHVHGLHNRYAILGD